MRLSASWNTITPIANVHAAPIPVQIAYAVPTGISFCAKYKKTPLSVIVITAKIIHKTLWVDRDAIFIPNGQPISNIAAINKYIQLIELPFGIIV